MSSWRVRHPRRQDADRGIGKVKGIMARTSFTVVVLICGVCGFASAQCPSGDLNGDCRVDWLDLGLLAEQWLSEPNGIDDLHGDAIVRMTDLGVLANHWRQTGCPIVINELLAHSHDVAPDWVELHNVSSIPIDIGGWFLSDSRNDLCEYRIAEGTIVEPNGYVLFHENEHFGNPLDPGALSPFKMSENGESLYLYSDNDERFGQCLVQARFGASETGVSFGRYLKSTGTSGFVMMSVPTPGQANAYPLVGPVVINEIMYRPAGDGDAEYVELLNISHDPVTFFDFNTLLPWRFRDNSGIEFAFPSDLPVTLQAGEHLLLVRNEALVRRSFSVPTDVQILQWGSGRLANSGETIQLLKPGDVDDAGTRYWIEVESITYSDGSHPEAFDDGIDRWPPEADGQGLSLNRLCPSRYGDDPNNWHATIVTPGSAND